MATQENVTPRQLELARKALWHQDGEALRTTESAREWVEAAGLVPLYPHAQFLTPAPSFAEAVLGRPENGWVPKRKASVSTAAAAVVAPGESGEESFAAEVEDEEPEEGGSNGTEEDFDAEEDGMDDEEGQDDSADEALEVSGVNEFEGGDADAEEEDEEDGEVEDDEDDEEEDEDLTDGVDDESVDGEDADSDEDEDEPATAEGDVAALAGDGNIPGDRETMLSDDDEFAEDEGDEIAEEDRIDAAGAPVRNDVRMTEEAGVQEPAPVPVNGFSAEERATVQRTLARLVEDGTVVPLNLLGSTTGEPDYLVSASAFSFVYTLRGDKNWKNEPATTGAMRVSPLAVKAYGVLKEKGALPLHEITTELGQGITDSATLRALNELWAIQRVLPLPNVDGRPAKWEIMSERYLRHMKAGANAGQPTALSALLSLYLAQTVAATTDEMEIFLSPLAARSRVRDVVHGLSATQQLEPLVVKGKTLLHIAGGLPVMPVDDSAVAPVFAQRSRYESDDRRAEFEERRAGGADRPARAASGGARPGFGAQRAAKYPVRTPSGARSGSERAGRPAGAGGERAGFGRGDRPAFGRGERSGSGPGERAGFGRGSEERERRPFGRRDTAGSMDRPERSTFARPWDEERAGDAGDRGGERRSFTPREGGGERRPIVPREGGERRPFVPREGGFGGPRKSFVPRESGGERRPFVPREGGGERRPFVPREGGGERRPFVPREGGGERRLFVPREGGERRPFTPREGGGERRPFVPREGGERRPFTPREGGFGGSRKSFGPPREGSGERRPFTPREGGGERRPFVPREGGDRRPFVPREGGGERRPFVPREGGFSGPRKSFGPPREGGQQNRPNRDRFSGEPGEGRPSFQAGAHSAGPGGAKFGGAGFGRDRGGKGAPGKFGRPGGRPSFKGPGSGPGRGGAPKRRPE